MRNLQETVLSCLKDSYTPHREVHEGKENCDKSGIKIPSTSDDHITNRTEWLIVLELD